MINRLIFVTGLVLLGASIVSGIVLLWLLLSPEPAFETVPLPPPVGPCNCQAGGPAPDTISGSLPRYLAIVGELPKHMDMNTSATIQIILTINLTDAKHYLSSDNKKTILHPDLSHSLDEEVGYYCYLQGLKNNNDSNNDSCYLYPTSVINLFGSGYELFASAHLIATSFDVQLLGEAEQSADQISIVWNWNISPKSAGDQSINQPINLNVDLHWKPVNNNGKEDIFRQIWEDNPTISVNPLPFIARGQVTISGTVTGLTGIIFTGFSLPWVYDQRKKRQQEAEKNKGNTPDDTQREQLGEQLKQERLEREQLGELLRRERLKREQLGEQLKQERLERERLEHEQLEHEQLKKRERLRRERLRHPRILG